MESIRKTERIKELESVGIKEGIKEGWKNKRQQWSRIGATSFARKEGCRKGRMERGKKDVD